MRLDHIEEVDQDRLWEGIARRRRSQKHPASFWPLTVAAAVILLLASALIWTNYMKDDTLLSASHFYPELETMETGYHREIDQRKSELSFDTLSAEDFPDIFREFMEVDSHYEQLLSELSQYPNKEAAIRVVIKYHERQLRLLERLSKEMEKKKHHEKKSNGQQI